MRILHASTFPDVHLCGVNTSRLQKKNTPRKTMWLHQHYLRMRIRWVAIISHRQEVCMWDLPQVCGHPRKLSLGCPGSSFQFYPFSCQSCRIEQCFFNNNEAQNRLSLQCTLASYTLSASTYCVTLCYSRYLSTSSFLISTFHFFQKEINLKIKNIHRELKKHLKLSNRLQE